MCEFCNYYHSSNGGISGKEIKILPCANETDLTDCQIHKGSNDDKYGMVIFSHGMTKGYFNINFCPICGRDLRSEENDKD